MFESRGATVSTSFLKDFDIVFDGIIGELRGCAHTQRTVGVKKGISQTSKN